MTTKKFKAIPFILGFLIILLLAGFMLGLKVVIEFDQTNSQMKTTKYIFLHIPVITDKQELWFSAGSEPVTPIDWELMHEIHYSAAGTKIKHTHWGAVVDPIILWNDLDLPDAPKSVLATRTRELIDDDLTLMAKRIYIRRIDIRLRQMLETPDIHSGFGINGDMIDALVNSAFIKPIDAEAAMIPDP